MYTSILTNESVSYLIVLFLISEHKHSKYKGRVFHGIIREDAKEGDPVQLDLDLVVTNKDKLTGGKYFYYTIAYGHGVLSRL